MEPNNREATGAEPPSLERLWTPRDYQNFLVVGERTYLEMEAAGHLAPPVILGPRLKRYIPEECRAKLLSMPRDKSAEPAQLRRARIERMMGVSAAT